MQLGFFDWGSLLTTVAQGATQVYSARQDVKNKITLLKAQQEAEAKALAMQKQIQEQQLRMMTTPLLPSVNPAPAADGGLYLGQVSHAKPAWLLPVAIGGAALAVSLLLVRRR